MKQGWVVVSSLVVVVVAGSVVASSVVVADAVVVSVVVADAVVISVVVDVDSVFEMVSSMYSLSFTFSTHTCRWDISVQRWQNKAVHRLDIVCRIQIVIFSKKLRALLTLYITLR